MKENEIDRILADIVAGENISNEDCQLLEKWQQHSEEHLHFGRDIQELAHFGAELKHRKRGATTFREVETVVKKQRRLHFIRKFSAAASIALFLGIAGYFILFPDKQNNIPLEVATTIIPGSPQAELILPQGKVIFLDSTTRVLPFSDSLAPITSDRNTLIYHSDKTTGQAEYHTIRVPRGGEYSLQLADQTKVYLNAGSSLHYPIQFNGDRREVILTGEGYFEVARDTARPFIVKAGNINMLVLGTAFNVNAYPEEETIATTLVEGKVQVDYGSEHQVMKPGTQLVYRKNDGKVQIFPVDTEIYTSWKDGYYYFKRETLENIMKVLSRWYDLNVFFQNADLKNIEFGGRLQRYEDIGYLLKRMEATQDVGFIIKGKTITVKRKTD